MKETTLWRHKNQMMYKQYKSTDVILIYLLVHLWLVAKIVLLVLHFNLLRVINTQVQIIKEKSVLITLGL